jgi:uncharacterized membrane protein
MKHPALNLRCLLAVLTVVPIAHANARAQQVRFTALGDLPGGEFASLAKGVSADGKVVLCQGYSELGPEAFPWTAESGRIALGDLPGGAFGSVVGVLSADGQVVLGGSWSHGPVTGGTLRLFRWTPATGMTLLPDGGISQLGLVSLSYDGEVILGRAVIGFNEFSFRWTRATGWLEQPWPMTGELVNDVRSRGTSADGSIVVGQYSVIGGTASARAFRWTEESGTVPLPEMLPENQASPLISGTEIISPDGRVICGFGSVSPSLMTGIKSCRWEADGSITILPGPPNSNLRFRAAGSNYDGSIVHGATGGIAALYDNANGIRMLQDELSNHYGLNLTGWFLAASAGCSWDARRVCGIGPNPDSTTHNQAWLVTLPLPGDTYADLSGDSRVDAKDVLPFTNCMKGPGVEAWGVCRTAADLDGDGDVDLRDYVKRLQVLAVNACGAVAAPPPPGGGMPGNPHALPGGMADVNLDCSVDGDDVPAFVDCLTGPWTAAPGQSDRFALSAACARADVNGDDAVDLRDVVMLQRTR